MLTYSNGLKVGIKLLKISHVRILFLASLLFVALINPYSVFKPGTSQPGWHVTDWFLEIGFVCNVSMRVCVCVCVSAPKAINN